jgi:hypothetical protein
MGGQKNKAGKQIYTILKVIAPLRPSKSVIGAFTWLETLPW